MSSLYDDEPAGECDECEEIFSGEGAIRTYLREDGHGGMVCVKCLYSRALDKTINAATVDLQARINELEEESSRRLKLIQQLNKRLGAANRRVNNFQSLLARERYWKRSWSEHVTEHLSFVTRSIKNLR